GGGGKDRVGRRPASRRAEAVEELVLLVLEGPLETPGQHHLDGLEGLVPALEQDLVGVRNGGRGGHRLHDGGVGRRTRLLVLGLREGRRRSRAWGRRRRRRHRRLGHDGRRWRRRGAQVALRLGGHRGLRLRRGLGSRGLGGRGLGGGGLGGLLRQLAGVRGNG